MQVRLIDRRQELSFEFPDDVSVSVREVLESAKTRRPELYQRWLNKEGQLRRSLAVFVNHEHIRYRHGLETELSDGDEVRIIPPIAGG